MLIILIATAGLALVALGVSLCRLAAHSDAADSDAVAIWLGTGATQDAAEAQGDAMPPLAAPAADGRRTEASLGL